MILSSQHTPWEHDENNLDRLPQNKIFPEVTLPKVMFHIIKHIEFLYS